MCPIYESNDHHGKASRAKPKTTYPACKCSHVQTVAWDLNPCNLGKIETAPVPELDHRPLKPLDFWNNREWLNRKLLGLAGRFNRGWECPLWVKSSHWPMSALRQKRPFRPAHEPVAAEEAEPQSRYTNSHTGRIDLSSRDPLNLGRILRCAARRSSS